MLFRGQVLETLLVSAIPFSTLDGPLGNLIETTSGKTVGDSSHLVRDLELPLIEREAASKSESLGALSDGGDDAPKKQTKVLMS